MGFRDPPYVVAERRQKQQAAGVDGHSPGFRQARSAKTCTPVALNGKAANMIFGAL
jgi:hypothetical protein